MLDTQWADRREAVDRKRRAPRETEAIVNNALMSPEARNLLNHLLSKPVKFQINQRYVIGLGCYGKRDRVRRLFREMILAGHCTVDPERNPDGTFKRGIYLVSDEPRWLASVDISKGSKIDEVDQIAEGNTTDPAPDEPSLGINNSRSNPDTFTGSDDAESRDRGSKSHLTRKAERRTGGAKADFPRKEPGKSPAKGSAVRGAASGAGDLPTEDRYTERRIGQMVDAASFSGSRMPAPRKAAGAIAALIQWQVEELDFEADVLRTIAEVCARVGDPDKPIVSWRYFTEAIREAKRRRVRPAAPAPERAAIKRQLQGWTPDGYSRRRS